MECVLTIVQVTKRVINYRIPFYRYLASECSSHDLYFSYWIRISPARKTEQYVSVFGLSMVQNVFQSLQKSSEN